MGASVSLGLLFTVNQSVTISQVGYWDAGGDGVQQGGPISVALFTRSSTTSGAIISGTQIDFTGTVGTLTGPTYFTTGQFRTANLSSPVTLTPGDYAIVAWGFGTGADYFIGGNISPAAFNTLGGALTFLTPGYYGTAGLFPANADGGGTYLAGSFVAAAIPEPSTYAAIIGAVALGVVVACRNRRRQPAA